MMFGIFALLFVLLSSPMDAMYAASGLSTRARPVVRRMNTVPKPQVRSRAMTEIPKQPRIPGVLAKLALVGAGYYVGVHKDEIMGPAKSVDLQAHSDSILDHMEDIFYPAKNINLEAYGKDFVEAENLFDIAESLTVEPDSEESLAVWKKDCKLIIERSQLHSQLKRFLLTQVKNVRKKEELRSVFHNAALESYLALGSYESCLFVTSNSPHVLDHLYKIRLAQFQRNFPLFLQRFGLSREEFKSDFRACYSYAEDKSRADRICIHTAFQSVLSSSDIDPEKRRALLEFYRSLRVFRGDTKHLRVATSEYDDIDRL